MDSEKATLPLPHSDEFESESDSEDDRALQQIRNSTELADHDRQVLLEEEEQEELLTEKRATGLRSFFGRKGRSEAQSQRHSGRSSHPRTHKARKRKHNGRSYEAGELLYEMEEGGAKDETSSQASSISADEQVPEGKQFSKVSQRNGLKVIH